MLKHHSTHPTRGAHTKPRRHRHQAPKREVPRAPHTTTRRGFESYPVPPQQEVDVPNAQREADGVAPAKRSETITYPPRTAPASTKARGTPIYVLSLPRVSPLLMLHIEERLFRHDPEKRNFLILNRPLPHHKSIVLGISGKPHDLVHVPAAKEDNIPLIRRFTGGGTVFINSHVRFFSFIINKADIPHVQPYPVPIMQWTGEVYNDVMVSLGEQLQRDAGTYGASEEALALHNAGHFKKPVGPTLPFFLNENDYCLHHLKFAGNAQALIRERILHHTSILWDMDVEVMTKYLTLPAKRPEYRRGRAHRDFLTDLRPLYDVRTYLGDAERAGQVGEKPEDDFDGLMEEYADTCLGGCPYTSAYHLAKRQAQQEQPPDNTTHTTPFPNIFDHVAHQQQQYMMYAAMLGGESKDLGLNDVFNAHMVKAVGDHHFDLHHLQLEDVKDILDVGDSTLGTWVHDSETY